MKPAFAPLFLLPTMLLGACDGPTAIVEAAPPPLVQAAQQGDLQALDRLLAQSSAPDVRDQCRWTPLMKAALHGHLEAALALLAAGAQVNATDKGGYSPLMLAASNNHVELVRLLADQGADLDHTEPGLGWTALIWAAKQGHLATAEALLEKGANPGLRDADGSDAADWARKNGHATLYARLRP